MENIFLESYDVFKVSSNAGRAYSDFLQSNRRYQITRCYYIIIIDNVFLTYSHLMLYEECLYLMYSQNRLKNGDLTLTIKKSDLVKKFKTDITKSASDVIKRFYDLAEVKISIMVKDKIEDRMNIIEYINTPPSKKYSDLPNEITIRLNENFVKLYRCAYLDKIEYINNSFNVAQGSFIRYFMQHDLDSGVKSSAIIEKMGVAEYMSFSKKKRFEQDIDELSFYYKNEKYIVKDGFVVSENNSKNTSNQNAVIELFGIIQSKVMQNYYSKNIIIEESDLAGYYNRFGKFESSSSFFKILNNMELMLNQSLWQDDAQISYFSHFFENIICKKDINFTAFIELSQRGLEYIVSRRANLDLYNIESADYGLTTYPINSKSCALG